MNVEIAGKQYSIAPLTAEQNQQLRQSLRHSLAAARKSMGWAGGVLANGAGAAAKWKK